MTGTELTREATMTNQQDTALLPVTDADRKCAQNIHHLSGRWSLATLVAAGKRDDDFTVQLIAAHRLQAPAEAGEEVERVARAIQDVKGGINYDYADFCRDAARAAITALRANAPEAQTGERAAIVAFLKKQSQACASAIPQAAEKWRPAVWSGALLQTADAIERGDHLASGAGANSSGLADTPAEKG